MQQGRSSWMIKPKSFIKLVGADYELMRNAGGSVLFKFYISSFVICLIVLVAFFSVRYAVELLFHIRAMEIFLSLFLSLLFLLMYVFLINTFTKDVRHRNVFNASNAVRVSFVVFMGFMLSKPLEIYVYENKLDNDVALYEQKLGEEHSSKIHRLFDSDVSVLRQQLNKYGALNTGNAFALDIRAVNKRIDSINTKQQKLIQTSWEKIRNGAYFIYRIKMVTHQYPLSWLICLAVILLFILPGFIIYSISKDETYFKMKKELETKIIRIAYGDFTFKYRWLFRGKYGLDVEFYSKYEDPPFNTKLKKEGTYQSSNDFHNKYGVK
jgi:hypothetical protein